jgi:predicted transcriptional regulator
MPDDTEVPLSKESSAAGRKRNEVVEMSIINIVVDKQPITMAGVANILNTPVQNIRHIIRRMVDEGKIRENPVLERGPNLPATGRLPTLLTAVGWKTTFDGQLVLDRPTEIPQLPDLMAAI